MYMVTIEDENGMFLDDPACSDTKEEAIRISREDHPILPGAYGRYLYRCEHIETIEEIVPDV